MNTNEIEIIDKKIAILAQDNIEYTFEELKEKVENILKSVNIFLVEDTVNTKALDMYLKSVITQKNNIKKEQEKLKVDESKETKYTLIESICKKLEFESQEELIKKVESLERKSNFELNEINNAF